jgi:hypothetical protein
LHLLRILCLAKPRARETRVEFVEVHSSIVLCVAVIEACWQTGDVWDMEASSYVIGTFRLMRLSAIFVPDLDPELRRCIS